MITDCISLLNTTTKMICIKLSKGGSSNQAKLAKVCYFILRLRRIFYSLLTYISEETEHSEESSVRDQW